MTTDFNPYTFGAGKMTEAEASRHINSICNSLNQGGLLTSRHIAFLLGYSVDEFNQREWQKGLNPTEKVLGRVKLYDKHTVCNFLSQYRPSKYRMHAYVQKRMGSKQVVKLLEQTYTQLGM